MCYFHFMFLYTCIGMCSKWSFPMHIFCAPQFLTYFTSKKIPIFHPFLWINTSGFFMSLSEYCHLFVFHMEGISYLLESLLPFSSLFEVLLHHIWNGRIRTASSIQGKQIHWSCDIIFVFVVLVFIPFIIPSICFYLICNHCAPNWHSELFIINTTTHSWW